MDYNLTVVIRGNPMPQPPAGKRELPATNNSVDHTVSFIKRHDRLLNSEMDRLGIGRSELIRRLLDEKYPPPAADHSSKSVG